MGKPTPFSASKRSRQSRHHPSNNRHRHRDHNSPPLLPLFRVDVDAIQYLPLTPTLPHPPWNAPPRITASILLPAASATLEEPTIPTTNREIGLGSVYANNQYAPLVFQPDFH